ncbi:MAG: alpha/beta hydrolase [Bilophila sp.]
MNFSFQRNPQRLVEWAGLVKIEDSKQERAFLQKLDSIDGALLRPLVLVVGGFLDQVLANSYRVCAQYPEELRARHDVWFREYYEGRAMRCLVDWYAAHGQPVALIGHSWGGDAAVNAVARKVSAHITQLITLDPVSRKGAPRQRLQNVAHWLNIYVDYNRTPLFDIPNIVARIGGPWEAVATADSNLSCPLEITHAFALAMFTRFGQDALRTLV